MSKNCIVYKANIEGYRLDNEVELRCNNSMVDSIKMYIKSNTVLLECVVTDLKDFESVEHEVRSIVEQILINLSYNLGAPVQCPVIESITSKGEVSTHLDLQSTVHIVRPILFTENQLQNILFARVPTHNYRLLYVQAIQNSDPIAQYMFLYNILLKIFGDSQRNVDNFIIKNSTEKLQRYKYTDWKGRSIEKNETIFTSLRNQLGHVRNATPIDTRVQMNDKLSDLKYLVKKAIEDIV